MILAVYKLELSPTLGVTVWAFYGVHPLNWGVLNLGACTAITSCAFSLRLCTYHALLELSFRGAGKVYETTCSCPIAA